MRNFMRKTILLSSLGCVLLVGTAIHLQAIAQNQTASVPAIPMANTTAPPLFSVTAQGAMTDEPSAVANADPGSPLDPGSRLASSQNNLSARDRQEFDYIIQRAQAGRLAKSSFGELVQSIAAEFRGYVYAADSLDQQEPEALRISLKQFDCVLFVEAMLGLARTIAPADYSEATFVHSMAAQRYRQGQMSDYCSRLHYFSEWILENQRQGLVQDLGEELGGVPLAKSLNFMSQNWQKYPRLVNNLTNRTCIQAMEQHLGTVNLRYVPTDRLRQVYDQLHPGDVIAVATRQSGLDVTHTGLVYKSSDHSVGMIHAAPRAGVIVSGDLQSYLERLGGDTIGVLVVRPQAPIGGQ